MLTQEQKNETLAKIVEKCKENNYTLLYAVIVGSHSYGLDTPESDVDARFIYAANTEHYIGFGNKNDSLPIDGNDFFGYELIKYTKLVCESNPTVMEILFMDEENTLYEHSQFKWLTANRKHFLSKQCYNPYIKYAEGQVYKAQSLTRETVLKLEEYENELLANGVDLKNLALPQLFRNMKSAVSNKSIGEVVDALVKLKKDKIPYSDLGEKRRKLLKEIGWDSKNLMHAIRLARTCRDIYANKELKVKRSDRDYLLAIRNGKYSPQDVEQELALIKREISEIEANCGLPDKVDRGAVENLCVHILKEVLFK